MSATGIEGIDRTVHVTNGWIHDIDERLGWDNRPKTYRLLKAVLHAVRDWLPINEGANLSAQLPTLLRGIYYEQWRPSTVPAKERDKSKFIARIQRGMEPEILDDPEAATGAVLAILAKKTTSGEIQDVRNALPKDIRALWPET